MRSLRSLVGATCLTVCAVIALPLAEKIWKRNRTAAIITMIGANIAYGVIASHNYSVARRSVK